jgi:hypothetical protein
MKSLLGHDKIAVKDGYLHVISCTLKDTSFLKKALMKNTTTVSFENPKEAIWFLAFANKILVGCCCLVIKGNTAKGVTARAKSDVVDFTQRGKGYYSALSKAREDFMRGAKVKRVTCYSTLHSRRQFLKDGYRQIGTKKNNVVYMEKVYGD